MCVCVNIHNEILPVISSFLLPVIYDNVDESGGHFAK